MRQYEDRPQFAVSCFAHLFPLRNSKYFSEKIYFKRGNMWANEPSVAVIGDYIFTVVTGTVIGWKQQRNDDSILEIQIRKQMQLASDGFS